MRPRPGLLILEKLRRFRSSRRVHRFPPIAPNVSGSPMDPLVFFAVLFGAACHAGWNAVLKFGLDPLTTAALIAAGAGIAAVPMVFVFGVPSAAAWPWLFGSLVFHLAYYLGLIEAYRVGDMGQVYPIARGTAPLITAAASIVVVGEVLAPLGWAG